MITFYKNTVKNRELVELKNFEVGSWIKVVNPTKEELDWLIKKFDLDKHNVYSSMDENEVPRYEKDDGIHYVLTKYVREDKLFTLLIVISNKFIITISAHDIEIFDVITTQRKKMLVKILLDLNLNYENEMANIIKRVNQLKRLRELSEKQLFRLLDYEHTLNDLMSTYVYLLSLYKKLYKEINFYEEDKDIVEDLMIEAKEGFELCKSSLKTISNLREYYLIILSNKLNRTITILTIFTIFIDIIAAISGIYGMNLNLPLQKSQNAFWIVMLIILIIWTVMLIIIKRKKII